MKTAENGEMSIYVVYNVNKVDALQGGVRNKLIGPTLLGSGID